ncbi:MAG: ADP-ribosylglycohydrolase family protein [Microbacterium sp.]
MTAPTAIRSTVLGLAAGDALSWTSADHREQLLSPRRLWMLRFLENYADQTRSTTRPRPHVHSSPTRTLRPGPSDDLEWFAFSTAGQLRELNGETGGVAKAWIELASHLPTLRARTGTQHALANLAKGQSPPQSGHDNPHYFDDIACVRAVAAGILGAESDALAASLAERDAQVTHSLDGVWCARGTAVLIAQLIRGADAETAVAAGLSQLPENTWSRRLAEQALSIAADARSALDLAMRLDTELTDKVYSYAVAAPETFAILIAHLSTASSADALLAGAFAHGRNADALPALAGALAGARFGADWLPRQLTDDAIEFDGICIPSLAGTQLEDTIRELESARSAA